MLERLTYMHLQDPFHAFLTWEGSNWSWRDTWTGRPLASHSFYFCTNEFEWNYRIIIKRTCVMRLFWKCCPSSVLLLSNQVEREETFSSTSRQPRQSSSLIFMMGLHFSNGPWRHLLRLLLHVAVAVVVVAVAVAVAVVGLFQVIQYAKSVSHFIRSLKERKTVTFY